MEDNRQKWILALFIALFLALLVLSESKAVGGESNPYSAWAVGSLGLDARSVALGGALTAAPPAWEAWNHNPAALPTLDAGRLYSGALSWAFGASLSQARMALSLRRSGVLELTLAEEAVIIPLVSQITMGAYWADEIAGFQMNPTPARHTWNIETWRRIDL